VNGLRGSTVPVDIVILKLKIPKNRSDYPMYKLALRLAEGKTSTASWCGQLFKLGRTELLSLWSMSFYLPTDALREAVR
jgi:hypothetical protein